MAGHRHRHRAGTVRRWESATGLPIGRPMQQRGRIRALAFSPDGKSIVSGSEDHTARLWDTTTGLPIGAAMRHAHIVQAAAFSPDGKSVVTGSWDRTARRWDAATGLPLGNPMKHHGWVSSVAISPDGTTILTGSTSQRRNSGTPPGSISARSPTSRPGIRRGVFSRWPDHRNREPGRGLRGCGISPRAGRSANRSSIMRRSPPWPSAPTASPFSLAARVARHGGGESRRSYSGDLPHSHLVGVLTGFELDQRGAVRRPRWPILARSCRPAQQTGRCRHVGTRAISHRS